MVAIKNRDSSIEKSVEINKSSDDLVFMFFELTVIAC